MKVENDDDDEIFIVHEEGEEGAEQENLFVDGADFQNFDDIDQENDKKGDDAAVLSPTIENPFVDNLANSENLPATQKLDVKINDDYLAQYSKIEGDEEEDKKRHNEKIK